MLTSAGPLSPSACKQLYPTGALLLTLAASASGHQGTTLQSNVLPPAHIHKALHSLLQGQPQTTLLPLLATKQLPCVQRTCDVLELYTLLNETNTACSQILFQAAMSAGAESAAGGAESAGGRTKPGSAKAELAGAAIQQGAEKLVLAMVNQVKSTTGLTDCLFSVVAVVSGLSADQIAWWIGIHAGSVFSTDPAWIDHRSSKPLLRCCCCCCCCYASARASC